MVVFLSNLPKIIFTSKKRKGRGLSSGKGAKSGRGITRHQKAREDIPLSFEGGQGRMIKKFPLWRGKGKNKPKKQSLTLSLSKLNVYKKNEQVDLKNLLEKKIITKQDLKKKIKLVSKGKLNHPLTVKIPVSKTAKLTIEKLGGKVI